VTTSVRRQRGGGGVEPARPPSKCATVVYRIYDNTKKKKIYA